MGNANDRDDPNLSPEEQAKRRKERETNQKLDQRLQSDLDKDSRWIKLLLLGAGESGKSTLFKQMRTIYGKGYSEQERISYINAIQSNVILAMKTLSSVSTQFGKLSKEAEASREVFEGLKGEEKLDSVLADHALRLWADPVCKTAFNNRSKFQIFDAAGFFFDKIKELAQTAYVPTYDDIIRIRVRTTGIFETEFFIDKSKFKMFDVGGQRNERKKWIHCFESVTAVVFVVAISEYDQMCYEDEKTNRMDEALALFDEICNSRWFKDTSMVLFLNKKDLFAEKITKVSLTTWNPDYTGPQTFEAATSFIKENFLSKNRNNNKVIYTHITCATDKDNVRTVFNAVKDIIIRQTLTRDGFI